MLVNSGPGSLFNTLRVALAVAKGMEDIKKSKNVHGYKDDRFDLDFPLENIEVLIE